MRHVCVPAYELAQAPYALEGTCAYGANTQEDQSSLLSKTGRESAQNRCTLSDKAVASGNQGIENPEAAPEVIRRRGPVAAWSVMV